MSDPIKPDFHAFRHEIRDGNAARGFHEDGDSFREFAKTDHPLAQKALANYYTNRMTLVMGEVIEAHEELRSGHSIGQVYYSGGVQREDMMGNPTGELVGGKPEGAVVELVDAHIRLLDLAAEMEEAGIIEDWDALVEKKLTYNETRGYKHGGRAF